MTVRALGALLAVEAYAGAAARLALVALLAVEAYAGAAAHLATVALLAVEAYAGAAARLALVAIPAVLALLLNAPLDWMRRRGIRCCCRSCCGCLFHDVNGGGSKF